MTWATRSRAKMSFLPVFANGFARSGGGSDRIPWNRAENQQNPMTYTRNNVNQYTDTAYPTESFTYDDDGNLTADGTYTYVWDAENRLTEVRATSPEAGSKKLVFAYDYMNRRVCKQLFTWNTGTSDWNTTPASDKQFVYDGWNVVLWLNGLSDNAVARKYTWGLDLSGLAGDGSVSGIHGAGGIGGLLAHQSSTGTSNFWYLYDGNGNVCQVLDRSYLPNVSWSTSGHFEYDAYGNIVHSRGVMGGVAQRAFCFSTKWLDTERPPSAGCLAQSPFGHVHQEAHDGREEE